MTKKAVLTIDGEAPLTLPVLAPTEGTEVIDVASLSKHGYFTYDPGFVATAACESALTYIDGDAGILMHRGYPIDQLAEQSSFVELVCLLLDGELPSAAELKAFDAELTKERAIPKKLHGLFNGFEQNAHPMSMVAAAIAGLAAYYHPEMELLDAKWRRDTVIRLVAKVPTIAALAYRHSKGLKPIAPRDDLNFAANFLHMTFSKSDNDEVNPTIAKAMDRIFMLHVDHEQNASTSTVRLAGSTEADPYACIAAGAAALWGPSHGGANEAVLDMLEEIGDESRIEEYVAKAKDKDDPFRLMGFGHRVYKNYDPRARVMQATCYEILDLMGIESDPTLQVARKLEKIALEDPYFADRKLYPNVDFYSGLTLRAIGIPKEMFTVIFTTGRTPGWACQWNEMITLGYKIGRPRQRYMGPTHRDYVSIDKR